MAKQIFERKTKTCRKLEWRKFGIFNEEKKTKIASSFILLHTRLAPLLAAHILSTSNVALATYCRLPTDESQYVLDEETHEETRIESPEFKFQISASDDDDDVFKFDSVCVTHVALAHTHTHMESYENDFIK